MAETSTPIPVGEALAAVERLLDRVDSARSGVDAATRLEWVRLARRVRSRIDALASLLVAEADRAHASERAAGTPMASWLGMGETLSRRESSSAVHQARALAARPELADAATQGRVGTGQVRAITKVLSGLASQLSDSQQARAEQVMIDLAGRLDADQLSKAASRVLEEVAPVDADELLETRLQREAEAAQRERSLRFFREGASIRFEGSLPRLEGEAWIALLDTHSEHQRRSAITARDPWPNPPRPSSAARTPSSRSCTPPRTPVLNRASARRGSSSRSTTTCCRRLLPAPGSSVTSSSPRANCGSCAATPTSSLPFWADGPRCSMSDAANAWSPRSCARL